MIFWFILAAMTVVSLAFVAWPFIFRAKSAPSGADLAVYRDQLRELERDRATGLLDAGETEAARIEVSRRLLKAADAERAASCDSIAAPESSATRLAVFAIALLIVPAVSAAFYYRLGTPNAALPKAPVATSGQSGGPTIEEMIAQVETHLQKKPDDARSWEVLAPVYMRTGRYDDAVNAWRNVIRLSGETAEAQENLGESIVASSDGVVTAEAKDAFDRALSLDKDAVAARYYRGLAALQDGRRDDAATMWRDLLASATPDASWTAPVRQSLARLEGKAPPLPERSQAGGPSARQMEDAAKLPDDQQDEMIRGMVQKLAAKLKLNGDDPQGWAMLVRSYNAIGDSSRAQAAEGDARKALAASPVKLAMFEEALKEARDAALPPDRAPTAAAPPAVAAAPPQQEGDMIRGMVARLADKLKQNGDDPEGWVRLVRSYGVLGEQDKMSATIADARRALAADSTKLRQFDEGLKTLDQPPR